MTVTFDTLTERLKVCTLCPRLADSRTNVVAYDGDPNPDVVFIGEAPGKNEDESGVPFVGRAGQVLRQHIKEYLDPARIKWGITNLVKCRPVEPPNRNGKPTKDEISACMNTWLLPELELLKPSLVVLLGDYALRGLADKSGISMWRGKLLEDERYSFSLFPTWHPAALVYDRKKQEGFREDFIKIVEFFA